MAKIKKQYNLVYLNTKLSCSIYHSAQAQRHRCKYQETKAFDPSNSIKVVYTEPLLTLKFNVDAFDSCRPSPSHWIHHRFFQALDFERGREKMDHGTCSSFQIQVGFEDQLRFATCREKFHSLVHEGHFRGEPGQLSHEKKLRSCESVRIWKMLAELDDSEHFVRLDPVKNCEKVDAFEILVGAENSAAVEKTQKIR